MANDVVPMSRMFRSCHEVLCKSLRLMHYAKLTELALKNLGLSRDDVSWHRQKEDVREKMLLKGRHDTFYMGQPSCLTGLRWWFEEAQLRLSKPTDGIIIPGHANSGVRGAFEALMRNPHMKTKTQAPLINRMRGRARGLVTEKHVSDWFQLQWPGFYVPPENDGRWETPCDHDFQLAVDDRRLKIDVSGPDSRGRFGNPGKGKGSTDLHLICELASQDVIWKAVVRGTDYDNRILPDLDGICPERMVVWLNCKRDGLDYEAIRRELGYA